MSQTESNVITTDDIIVKTPKSFRDLKKDKLVEAANYFGSDSEGGVDTLRANLEQDSVTWAMYAQTFLGEEPVEVETLTPLQVDVEDWEDGEVLVNELVTAPEVPVLKQKKYLVKMVRENPYFEFKKYRFTQERPYVIMEVADAQRILEDEQGFRQAFPSELEEFYS